MVAEARSRGSVSTVHADREKGFGALEGDLLALGIRLSVTQGSDPQANGLAEQTVGQLSRMARGVLATYPGDVQACLWQDAMVWAAQRLSNAKLPPLGAKILARHPPKTALGKLAGRSVTAVYLHQSARTAGAAHIGLLNRDRVQGKADRRTIRAVLGQDGKWVFPKITCVEKRRQATSEGGGDDATADTHSDNEWFDGNAERNIQGACQELSSSFLEIQDDAMRDYLNPNRTLSAEPEGGRQDKRARPTGGHAITQGDDADEGAATAKRPKPEDERTSTHGAEDVPMEVEGPPGVMGLVTRAVPLRSEEAQSTAARAAIEKELQNIIGKGVFETPKSCTTGTKCASGPRRHPLGTR